MEEFCLPARAARAALYRDPESRASATRVSNINPFVPIAVRIEGAVWCRPPEQFG